MSGRGDKLGSRSRLLQTPIARDAILSLLPSLPSLAALARCELSQVLSTITTGSHEKESRAGGLSGISAVAPAPAESGGRSMRGRKDLVKSASCSSSGRHVVTRPAKLRCPASYNVVQYVRAQSVGGFEPGERMYSRMHGVARSQLQHNTARCVCCIQRVIRRHFRHALQCGKLASLPTRLSGITFQQSGSASAVQVDDVIVPAPAAYGRLASTSSNIHRVAENLVRVRRDTFTDGSK